MILKLLVLALGLAGSAIASAEIPVAPLPDQSDQRIDINYQQRPVYNPPPRPVYNPPPRPVYNPPPPRSNPPPPRNNPPPINNPPPGHVPPQQGNHPPGGGNHGPVYNPPPHGGGPHGGTSAGQHNGGSVVHGGGQQIGIRHIPAAAAGHIGHHGHLGRDGVWIDDNSDPIYYGEYDDGTVISQVTFSFTNNADDDAQIEFFSDNSGDVWPGGNQAYSLAYGGTLSETLNCTGGENICYGGWKVRDYNSTWGSGHVENRQHCDDCCLICDGRSHSWNLTP